MKHIAIACALLVACSSNPRPRPVVTHKAPSVVLHFHGDVDFSTRERWFIGQAIHDLEFQTAGLYRLDVVYDLNFSAADLTRFAQSPLLVRADSHYEWLQAIEETKEGHLLGVTMTDNARRKPPIVYLVADRLSAAVAFHHVAMHELLHAAGLDDLGPYGSVMSGAMCDARRAVCEPTLCMTPADQAEFCRVNHCRVAELNGCEW